MDAKKWYFKGILFEIVDEFLKTIDTDSFKENIHFIRFVFLQLDDTQTRSDILAKKALAFVHYMVTFRWLVIKS